MFNSRVLSFGRKGSNKLATITFLFLASMLFSVSVLQTIQGLAFSAIVMIYSV